jgi:predicted ATPase
MWIKEVSISNYARFDDLGPIKLARNRTAIVGQNNVGKSAFLKAFSAEFSENANRTRSQKAADPSLVGSQVHLLASIDGTALFPDLVRHAASTGSAVGIPLKFSPDMNDGQIASLFDKAKEGKDISVSLSKKSLQSQGIFHSINSIISYEMTYSSTMPLTPEFTRFSFERGAGRKFAGFGASIDEFKNIILSLILNGVYWFQAERLNIAKSDAQLGASLYPSCRNLPAVLDNVQIGRVFDDLQKLVSYVIPSVKRIRVGPGQGGPSERQILVWQDEYGDMNDGISLVACGSGVGQALAILTAALISDTPRVILIDEPNSFLHPSATRSLMSILAGFKQHQFIIATHSMEALRAFDPETVVMLEARGSETIATTFYGGDLAATRKMLSDLGVSVADLTGADYSVWVEGQTEADVFPYLATKLLPDFARRVVFPRVGTTGAFDGRRKRDKAELLQIYRNLSEAVVMMPSSTTFLFDREARSKEDRADLEREMEGKIAFLPRYCFENYLLDAEIIAEALKDQPGLAETAFDAAKIEAWWAEHAIEAAYWPKDTRPKPITDDTWRADINAAKLLSEMVDSLSGGKAQYRKTVDSVAIAKLLLDHKPDSFREIADIILGFLPKAASS